MTLRIGIIGAENSHALHYAKAFNVAKRVAGMTVDCIWGEKPEFAKKVAEAAAIPRIVKRPADMLGSVEAVIVDHRHAKYHLPAALPFVEAGLPVFVDKPFCYRVAEGRRFLQVARKRGAPVSSFSIIPEHRRFRRVIKDLPSIGNVLAATLYGPCDLQSPYGGVFFYGIHQVTAAVEAFGDEPDSVLVTRNGNGAAGQLLYPGGFIVTLNFIKSGNHNFYFSAVGEKGLLGCELVRDADPFRRPVQKIAALFRSGKEPVERVRILRTIAILEALEKSVRSRKVEKVEKIRE